MKTRQIIITTVFFTTVVLAAINFYTSARSVQPASPSNPIVSTNAPAELPISHAQYESGATPITPPPTLLSASLKIELSNLLKAKEFSKLDAALEGYQRAADIDIAKEKELYIAYTSFAIEDQEYAGLFDGWVSASSNRYQSLVARAMYYHAMGWAARGGNWASETKKDQLNRMTDFFQKSIEDIGSALALDGRGMFPYRLASDIFSVLGDGERASQVHATAININPASYMVRVSYLHFLSPRWGGTYDAMKHYINESSRYVDQNPRLRHLAGDLYSELADRDARVDKFNSAEALYTKALEFGDNHATYSDRGIARYRNHKYDEALSDLNKAIELNPESESHYYWRAHVFSGLSQYDNAAKDVLRMLELAPWDARSEKLRRGITSKLVSAGHELHKGREFTKAIDVFSAAITISPNDPDVYNRRSVAFYNIGRLDEALADVKRAIILDPSEFLYYSNLDRVLEQRRDWNQIISYWNIYISLNSDDAYAYYERSGTYFNKRDMKASIADAKRAADLGHVAAKEMYEKFKHLAR